MSEVEERYAHPNNEQPAIHVFKDDWSGNWVVWLNTGVSDCDGLVIGCGATRDEAVGSAVGVAEWVERTLQSAAAPARFAVASPTTQEPKEP